MFPQQSEGILRRLLVLSQYESQPASLLLCKVAYMNNLEAYRQKPQDVWRQHEISTNSCAGIGNRGKLAYIT